MADILGSLSFSGIDALGVPVNFNEDFTTTDDKTLAQAATFANNAFDHLTPASDAGWTKIAMTFYPVVNNPTSPQDTSIAERTGLFNLSQTGSRFKYGVDVESLDADLIINGKIDLAANGIADLMTFLTTAHAGFQFINKAANALVALIDALISFRKKRKLESRRSFEVPS